MKKQSLQNAKNELSEKLIPTSEITLYQEGLPSEHYSMHIVLKTASVDFLNEVFEIAHKYNLSAKLNRLYRPLEGNSDLILEMN